MRIARTPARAACGLLALALAACSSATGSEPSTARTETHMAAPSAQLVAGSTAELALDQSVRLAATGIRARFVRVVEDSRCPTGVDCVWAGRAVVEVGLTAGDGTESLRTVDLSQPESRRVRLEGSQLTLVITRLEPYPEYLKPIADPDRRLHLDLVGPE